MGLGKDTTPRTYLKLNTKQEKPVFKVYQRNAKSGKFEHTQDEIAVSGYFKSIKFVDNEYEGVTTKRMNLTLTDKGMDYVIDSSLSMTCRSIINTLCSYPEIGFVEVTLSSVESNGKRYPRVYLNVNGDTKPEWKLSIEEQRELTEVIEKKNGTKEYDFYDLNSKLIQLASVLKPLESNTLDGGSSFEEAESSTSGFMEAQAETQKLQEEDDDLPF